MIRRTRTEWLALFAQHDSSGVSATEFCKDNDLCPKHLSLRLKQLAAPMDEVENGFAQVTVKPETKPIVSRSQSAALIIHSGAGQLVFCVLPPPGWLAQLLKVLA